MLRATATPSRPLRARLGWFLGLWAVGVLGLAAIGTLIKLALR